MNIRKPHKFNFNIIKKYPDRYFDWMTDKEFPYKEINNHAMWYKRKYDNNKKILYFETYYGYWYKREYNEVGQTIYYENSHGKIRDYRR